MAHTHTVTAPGSSLQGGQFSRNVKALPPPRPAPCTPTTGPPRDPCSSRLYTLRRGKAVRSRAGRTPDHPQPLSPQPSPPTNPSSTHPTQRGERAILALDVEFTHLEVPAQGARRGRRVSVATWVALVDRFGGVPLKAYCALPATLKDLPGLSLGPDATPVTAPGGNGGRRPGVLPSAAIPYRTDVSVVKASGGVGSVAAATPHRVVGGVKKAALRGAPSLSEVKDAVLAIIYAGGCNVLVGHGLSKDLQSLGIDEDADLRGRGIRTYDTMSYGKFQGRGGAARTLAALAAEFLGGRVIQGGAHDPEEDARAAVDLYVRHVDYEYMVEYETLRLIGSLARRAQSEETDEFE